MTDQIDAIRFPWKRDDADRLIRIWAGFIGNAAQLHDVSYWRRIKQVARFRAHSSTLPWKKTCAINANG